VSAGRRVGVSASAGKESLSVLSEAQIYNGKKIALQKRCHSADAPIRRHASYHSAATTPAAPAATSISSTTASNRDRILSSRAKHVTCPFAAIGSTNGIMFLFVTGPQGRAGIGSCSCVCSFLLFTFAVQPKCRS
jgi:hypothetical protein